MSTLTRVAPLTPLDELRGHLSRYSEEAGWASQLNYLLQKLQQMALPELGERLLKPTSGKPLKRAILSLTTKFDWPEWTEPILKALLTEPDLGVFDEGCAALGRLVAREAYDALLTLQAQRPDPDRRLIVQRELNALDPSQPLSFFISRLSEGEGNPRLAHQGARQAAVLATEGDLPALVEAYRNGDPLTARLALRVISGLPGGAAGTFLLDLFQQLMRNLTEQREQEALINRVHLLQRVQAREELIQIYAARLKDRCGGESAALLQAMADEEANPIAILDRMAPHVRGEYEAFLAESVQVLVEGKVARFSALLSDRLDQSQKLQETHSQHLDQVALGLHRQAKAGHLPRAQVVAVLSEGLARFHRQEGVALAFCWLVDPEDEACLARVQSEQDPKRRMFLLDALGAREEDRFTAFFLKALEDPIVEVGHRAIHHLGRLPSAFPVVMARFQSGQPDQVRQSIRIFRENRNRAAAESLTAFVSTEQRDDLMVEAVEALGAIAYPPATPVLLEHLHDGKPARLQIALATALGAMETPEASLGLLAKAPGLKIPTVLILCLEGLLAGFPSFDQALPEDALGPLDQLLKRCMDEREGEGVQLRAILATMGLYCFDQGLYARWRDRFSDVLFDLRTKGNWDRDTNEKVAAVVKELGQRAASLAHIAQKEEQLRNAMRFLTEKPAGRADALMALKDQFLDPEFILRAQMAEEVAAWVLQQLRKPTSDWREVARLCEIGGHTHRPELVDPIREHLRHATGLGLRSAAREALLKLGVPEDQHLKFPPIRHILLLEPSAFFRKRLRSTLEPTWEVREAGSREEAESLLAGGAADLLITELQDAHGDLRAWITARWEARAVRQVLLACASRDVGTFLDHPWVMGILNKPFPPEALLKALEP